MSQTIHPLAGQVAPASALINVREVTDAYVNLRPDPANAAQRISFGTSGHRGRSADGSFNEYHVLAISQAVCDYRTANDISGPLFLGLDTHALSQPAFATTLQVLAANGVVTMVAPPGEYTPTPALSHAILRYNRGGSKTQPQADGIVITPSHNPPDEGGYKYNPPNGGPAQAEATNWIESRANQLLEEDLRGVRQIDYATARTAATTVEYDYLNIYVSDLGEVVDFPLIAASGLRLGVDPLGGAGVHYWSAIEAAYRINLDVRRDQIDPTFAFMCLDWDGRIRMDPSSPWAMKGLISLKDTYDVAFACDTDHDRHGIVTGSDGLMDANQYLATLINYLFSHRSAWSSDLAIGKTLVSTAVIDKVASRLNRALYEVPVGFKWFADGLLHGRLGFAGEESAGASFLRSNGSVWTTDKDGFIPSLLAAEMTARCGRDPAQLYQDLITDLGLAGPPVAARLSAPIDLEQKKKFKDLSPEGLSATHLVGEKITAVHTSAPGNGAPVGGIKVVSANGWFAARPSGTEAIYKIYAESFTDQHHLDSILTEAQEFVSAALS